MKPRPRKPWVRRTDRLVWGAKPEQTRQERLYAEEQLRQAVGLVQGGHDRGEVQEALDDALENGRDVVVSLAIARLRKAAGG